MKTIINDRQRGFLFRNGKFTKLLSPGKYHIFGNWKIELAELKEPIHSNLAPLDILLKNSDLHAQTVSVQVDDHHLALHFVNGIFEKALLPGRYAFWTIYDKHEFMMVDTASPEVAEEVPNYIFPYLPSNLYAKIEVAAYEKARLFFNGKFERLLDAGVYYFWDTTVNVQADWVDTRLIKMDITGQEMLTQDKVSIRVNFVCNYRITDYIKIYTDIDDYKEQIHVAAQLAMRDYVGKHRMDEILENKEEMSNTIYRCLKEKESLFFVEFLMADVKDIILPGEMRDIMNTVLIAEKRAQANVITRREEVASTRSLLNTAKMMEENPTLYRLKEMEYIERICENVGDISISGSSDLLSQLTTLLHSTGIAKTENK